MHWETEEEIAQYTHPFRIGGVRYLFKENPIEYLERAARIHFAQEVQDRAYDIAIEQFYKNRSNPSHEECLKIAAGEYAKKVLVSSKLLDWMKEDGLEFRIDVEQFRTQEKEAEELERM